MTERSVSVIVVSRGRPDALRRCLRGLEQLFHQNFELIVVADPPGVAVSKAADPSGTIKHVAFDEPNISAARNAGIARAAGDVVAFIDDDAVPEPTWLCALSAAFEDPSVASAGGYVRGRNGISFQSTGAWVDASGAEQPETRAGVFDTKPGRAIKTVGTNCAFRRSDLAGLGGFDPAFKFYLDETDVNLRLAADSKRAAIMPEAEVHHGFLASAYRTANRAPRSLFQIGASLVVFLRKHFQGVFEPVLDAERLAQFKRLERHVVAGTCEPRDLSYLMADLEDGYVAGYNRTLRSLKQIEPSSDPFVQYRPRMAQQSPHAVGARWPGRRTLQAAYDAAEQGARPSLFLLSATALYHRVSYERGVWVQRGGVFGRSDRAQGLFQAQTLQQRVAAERKRVARQRRLDKS